MTPVSTVDLPAFGAAQATVRDTAPVFDTSSGNPLERLIFNHRRLILLICALLTLVLGWSASQIEVNANYSGMLPQHQTYVINAARNQNAMMALGDSVRIVVENKTGSIYDPRYLAVLRTINDRVFLLPGVDRSFMKSLWTSNLQWTSINEQGVIGGPVMPETYDGSPASIAELRQNILQANIIGSVVANDLRSSAITVPLLDTDPATGRPFDYGAFWHAMQTQVVSLQSPSIGIHIVGFAAIIGYMIAALRDIVGFFVIAALIATGVIFAFTRCLRSTAAILSCSSIAVLWLLGIIRFLGFELDPYSVLFPFLIFAIGVSHGAQKMNGIMQDIGRGASAYVAARLTFRRLFVAGLTGLIADAAGFAVLSVIAIQAIRTLAITASIGVVVLIFTNLVLLPIVLSYIGAGSVAAARSLRSGGSQGAGGLPKLAALLGAFCERKWAGAALTVAVLLCAVGLLIGRNVQIGDVNPGAPELRPHSTYNLDNAYVIKHYSLSSDQFAVIVRAPTAGGSLITFPALEEMDRLEQAMRKVPGVQTTTSAADMVRTYTSGAFEGNLKWWAINRNDSVLSQAMNNVFSFNPELVNNDYSAAPVIIYLKDHRARTLSAVAAAAQNFADAHNSRAVKFLLAAGSGGMAQATNIVVERANLLMPVLVYGAVIILCFISFRSWRAVIVAVVPLALTSVLCQALMVVLGIGVKVATLPVTALGVGIGVDYALYLLSVQLAFQRAGEPLRLAYQKALGFTGRIVALVGLTLAAGVAIWVFSPIEFQADMGVLLTFMFLWNMLGALVLIPALSYFLLQTDRVARQPPRAFRQDGGHARILTKES